MCSRAVQSARAGWSIALTLAENRLFDLEQSAPTLQSVMPGVAVSAITQLLSSTLSTSSSSSSSSSSLSTASSASSSTSAFSAKNDLLELVRSVVDHPEKPEWRSPNLFVSLVRRVSVNEAAANLFVEAVASPTVAHDVGVALNGALSGLMRTIVGSASAAWRALSDAFLELCRRSASFRASLHATLRTEAGMAHKGWSGRDFEFNSILGSQLSYTSIPHTGTVFYFRLLAKRRAEVSSLQGDPTHVNAAIDALSAALAKAVGQQQQRVHSALLTLIGDEQLDNAVIWEWCAAVFEANEIRVSSQQSRDHMSADMQQFSSSESFLCNLGAVVLRFCEPHVRGALANGVESTLHALDDSFASVGPRFGLAHFEPLRSATDNTAQLFSTSPSSSTVRASPSAPIDPVMTETMFAAMRALHVCISPALLRNEQYKLRLRQVASQLSVPGVPFLTQELLRTNGAFASELELPHSVVVGAASFVETSLALATTVLLWLADRAGLNGERPSTLLFGALPACTVADACRTLIHVLRCARPTLARYLPALAFVRAATFLIASPALVAHPPTRATLSDLLLSLLMTHDMSAADGNGDDLRALDAATQSIFESDTLVCERLVRGLSDAYVAVGIVEGLDVDKQQFDKYSARQVIAEALLEAWQYAPHVVALRAFAAAPLPNAPLEALIDTVLNDVLHLVDDALQRIVNVRQLELAEADPSWSLQSMETIVQRRRYADGERMVARGFLGMAMSMLHVLGMLARTAPTMFVQPRLLPKTTSMLLRFMAQLCVPERVAQLAVKQPERCGFDAAKLRSLVFDVAAPLGGLDEFVNAFHRDYAFEPQIMEHVEKMVRASDSASLAALSRLPAPPPSASAASSDSGGNVVAIEAAPLDKERLAQLETRYLATLSGRRFDAYAMRHNAQEPYHHHFATRIADTAPGAARLARIMQECESLTGDTLPLTLQSGVFVRVDEERIDVMKALIIGAEGTPYSGGAFEFDVFLPGDYPAVPPLVNLETTGNGTVRFNPNLYNCGKVCLSILGTWHGGGDSASKWNASHSTIQQVLVSIQGLILIEKPYFNEPAYEQAAGTREGDLASQIYNETLRLATARHAILDPLRRLNSSTSNEATDPAHAFDATVLRPHFALQRPRLLAQLVQWRDEASEANRAKFARVLSDIAMEIDKLEETK